MAKNQSNTDNKPNEQARTENKSLPEDPLPVATDGTRKTPDEWAVALEQYSKRGGLTLIFNGKRPGDLIFSPLHAAASQLHGWKLHEHHAGTPMQITRAQYEAALKSASCTARVCAKTSKPVDGSHNGPVKHSYVPHGAALSPHLTRKEFT